MGFILLGLACLNTVGLNGTVYFMFAHGVMAALGFALVGAIYEQTHTRMLDDWGGLGKKTPFIATLFVMTAMASSGVPGFANFIGEMLILMGSWDKYPVPTVFAVAGLVITAGYMLKTVRFSMQGPLNPRLKDVRDPAGLNKLPYLVLIGFLVLTGFLPMLLMPVIRSGTANVIKHLESGPKIILKQEIVSYGP